MKPTQQEIIDLAYEDGGHTYPEWLRFVPIFALERLVHLALERFGAGGGEPVAWQKAIIRGEEWGDSIVGWEPCTKSEARYLMKPTRPLYTHPSPTDLRAEYLRGLEDAAKVADANATDARTRHAKFRCVNIAEAIRALKGKQ